LNPSTGQIQTDDGSTWVFTSPANTWLTTIFAGSSTIRLGVNNALPVATLLNVGNGAANRLDLAGFNQQVGGMEIGTGLAITNSSSVTDSTLTYSSGSLSTYGGTISDGTRKLNLTLAGNSTLVLTNPTSLNLTKSSVTIPSGSVLQLDYTGTNTVNALVLNGVSLQRRISPVPAVCSSRPGRARQSRSRTASVVTCCCSRGQPDKVGGYRRKQTASIPASATTGST
jgi:hypothetical protein